jgi:hypothetical protein
MADNVDRVMRTYWPPSRPWRYSLDFHRQPIANWDSVSTKGVNPSPSTEGRTFRRICADVTVDDVLTLSGYGTHHEF